jgi:hypothetical protein
LNETHTVQSPEDWNNPAGAALMIRKLGYFEYLASDKFYGWFKDMTDQALMEWHSAMHIMLPLATKECGFGSLAISRDVVTSAASSSCAARSWTP